MGETAMAVAAIGSLVLGAATTAYTMLTPKPSYTPTSSTPQLYLPRTFTAPTPPDLSKMMSQSVEMPQLPTTPDYAMPPTPSENIVAPDEKQTHRMGSVRAAYFSGEYTPETTGAISSTSISEDNSGQEKTALQQVLG